MNKKVASIILATTASLAITGAHSEKVLANEINTADNIKNESNNEVNARSSKKAKVVNVSSNLRIRSSASTNSSVVGSLRPGAIVNIEGESGSWYKIEYNGTRGYSHKDYLSVVSGDIIPTPPPTPDTSISKDGQVTNVTSSLRIRSASNTSSSIVGYLYPNEKFKIIGESGSWYKINHKGKTGYIHKDYVKVISSGGGTVQPPTPDVKPENGKGEVINVSSNLRIRSNPSTSSSIVGYLSAGNRFDITGKSGSWYKINYNGKIGYVHSDYVRKVTDDNNGGQVSNKYDKVLSIMKAHIGTPYVFGGSGEYITTSSLNALKNRFPGQAYSVPSKYMNANYRAFDCSGFTQWAFNQVGVSLGRTTYDQVNAGVEVNASNAKAGDLLFFSNLGHVGMYIGNGQWIESPKTGEYVRITNVPWNLIGRARRVL